MAKEGAKEPPAETLKIVVALPCTLSLLENTIGDEVLLP